MVNTLDTKQVKISIINFINQLIYVTIPHLQIENKKKNKAQQTSKQSRITIVCSTLRKQ